MRCLTSYKVCQDKIPYSFFLLVSRGGSTFALAQDIALWPHELHCQYVSCHTTWRIQREFALTCPTERLQHLTLLTKMLMRCLHSQQPGFSSSANISICPWFTAR